MNPSPYYPGYNPFRPQDQSLLAKFRQFIQRRGVFLPFISLILLINLVGPIFYFYQRSKSDQGKVVAPTDNITLPGSTELTLEQASDQISAVEIFLKANQLISDRVDDQDLSSTQGGGNIAESLYTKTFSYQIENAFIEDPGDISYIRVKLTANDKQSFLTFKLMKDKETNHWILIDLF